MRADSVDLLHGCTKDQKKNRVVVTNKNNPSVGVGQKGRVTSLHSHHTTPHHAVAALAPINPRAVDRFGINCIVPQLDFCLVGFTTGS